MMMWRLANESRRGRLVGGTSRTIAAGHHFSSRRWWWRVVTSTVVRRMARGNDGRVARRNRWWWLPVSHERRVLLVVMRVMLHQWRRGEEVRHGGHLADVEDTHVECGRRGEHVHRLIVQQAAKVLSVQTENLVAHSEAGLVGQ